MSAPDWRGTGGAGGQRRSAPGSRAAGAEPVVADQEEARVVLWHEWRTLADSREPVHEMSWSPDGALVAVLLRASGFLRIWEVATGQFRAELARASRGWLASSKWSPDGSALVTSDDSSSTSIWLWDTATGSCLKGMRSRALGSLLCEWSPDGDVFAVSELRGQTVLYSASGQVVTTLGHAEGLAFQPRRAQTVGDRALVTYNGRGTVWLWEAATGRRRAALSCGSGSTSLHGWSPQADILAVGAGPGRTVRLWDVATGAVLAMLDHEQPTGGLSSFLELSWSPDGKTIASACSPYVWFWDVATGQLAARFEVAGSTYKPVWSPDGRWLAVGGVSHEGASPYLPQPVVTLFDLAGWTRRRLRIRPLDCHLGEIPAVEVSWSPDSSAFTARWGRGGSWLWDAAAGECRAMLGGDLDRMEWSSDGAEVIGYTEGGAVHWWEAATGRRRASMPPLIVKAVPIYGQRRTRVFWSPDRQLAATSLVDGSVTLWARLANLDAGYPMNGRVLALAWGPGERLAVGSDGGVVIVDLRADGREVAHLTTGWNWVWTLAWRPDGGQLALAGDHDEAAIWDVCTGEKARALRGHSAWVRSVAWSPDGESVATGSNDESIRLWRVGPADRRAGPGPNLAAASPVGVVLRGHYGAVRSLAWSPSGQWLASGSDDWTVRLWNVAAAGTAPVGALDGPAELVAPGAAESGRTLPGPGQPVRSVAWSPGGDYLAAAGGDGTVWRFDVRAGFEVRTFDSAAGPTESVAWLGPHTLVAGYRDGFIAAWDARSGNELLPRRLDCRLRALASNGTRLAAGGEAGGVGLGEPGPVRSA